MARTGVHVIRDGDRWWVLREGEDGVPAAGFNKLREAVKIGTRIARQAQSEITVYDGRGRVRLWDDYREL